MDNNSQCSVDVSIVIVNWNTRRMLLDCIESLKKETSSTKIEIIVVDNGSTDGSQKALKETYPDVCLIENGENLGFAKANNIGIARSSGRYVCLVNSDIIALDSCIDRMVAYMDNHRDVGALGPKTVDENRNLRQNCRRFPTLWNACSDYLFLRRLLPFVPQFSGRTLRRSTYEKTHPAEVLSGCFLMVRRKALEEVGLLDERFFFYGEDTDWCKRFDKAGWGIVFFSEATAIHFGGASTAAYPVKYFLAMEKADYQYWLKHHRPLEVKTYHSIKIAYHAAHKITWSLVLLTSPSEEGQVTLKAQGHTACLRWLLFREDAHGN